MKTKRRGTGQLKGNFHRLLSRSGAVRSVIYVGGSLFWFRTEEGKVGEREKGTWSLTNLSLVTVIIIRDFI